MNRRPFTPRPLTAALALALAATGCAGARHPADTAPNGTAATTQAAAARAATTQNPATQAPATQTPAAPPPAAGTAIAPAPATQAPAAAAAASTTLAGYDTDAEIFHPVQAQHGMVASEQHLATQIGVDILKKGGNAVDAAVAVGFALAAALPNAGNIGGGGFMVVHDARSGKDVTLDFREVAPAGASRDMYVGADGKVVPERSTYTPLAVGVPGTVAGLDHALRRWGTMSLAQVVAPAARLAEQGIPVSASLAAMLKSDEKHLGRWASSKAIYFRDGRPLAQGERLVNRDLARSLRQIATAGPKAFYDGPIAEEIVATMKEHGGLITREDLRAYRPVEREPVQGDYRGYHIVAMPPPSSGGVHIVQMLNVLSHFPLATYGAGSAQTVQTLAETMKVAYADRAEFLGDPAFTKVPVAGLTSAKYADAIAQRIGEGRVVPARDIRPGNPRAHESDQTTHFSVVDRDGNAVAVTYTLNLNFGSGLVAGRSGVLLNNEMDDFSAKPGVPNAFGLVGGEANSVQPGKRPLSSMSPTIVLKDGRPWLVTGSPGGSRIITTTLQTIVDAIDFGMNPAEAAAQPRVHHQWAPDELRVERGLSPDTLALLRQRGYAVAVRESMGRTQTIQVRDGVLYGASDPRNPDGATIGY